MTRAVTQVSRLLVGIAGIGIIVMLVLVVADVLTRAVFNSAIPGVDTIVASYLMVATIFLPLALIQLRDENIAVDILRDAMPDVVKDAFDIVGHVFAVVFYLILAWLYLEVAVQSFNVREFVSGTWNVPIWPARIIMPVGLAFGALAALAMAGLALRNLLTGRKPSSHHSAGAV